MTEQRIEVSRSRGSFHGTSHGSSPTIPQRIGPVDHLHSSIRNPAFKNFYIFLGLCVAPTGPGIAAVGSGSDVTEIGSG